MGDAMQGDEFTGDPVKSAWWNGVRAGLGVDPLMARAEVAEFLPAAPRSSPDGWVDYRSAINNAEMGAVIARMSACGYMVRELRIGTHQWVCRFVPEPDREQTEWFSALHDQPQSTIVFGAGR